MSHPLQRSPRRTVWPSNSARRSRECGRWMPLPKRRPFGWFGVSTMMGKIMVKWEIWDKLIEMGILRSIMKFQKIVTGMGKNHWMKWDSTDLFGKMAIFFRCTMDFWSGDIGSDDIFCIPWRATRGRFSARLEYWRVVTDKLKSLCLGLIVPLIQSWWIRIWH